jgi:acyl-CoA reductase-like NAD-dependent aldehyde dehydrogenase
VNGIKEYRYFAGGEWRTAENHKLFDVFRPYDRSLYARVAAGGRSEAKLAVDAAAKAFPAWSQTTPAERARLFFKAAEIVKRRRAEIAEILPKGVINVVTHAPGAAGEIADVFFESQDVRVINLIGGVKTAKMLAKRAGETLKRTTMELGGYNPMIILADVDVDYAVRTATFGSFFHQGQICLNTRRIIVQRKIANEFLEKFTARTKTLRSGDPQDPKTVIGPLITPAAVKLVDDRVKEALAKGAKLHTGGVFEGQIYQPTILSNVSLDTAIANEETFGPVVVVEVVDTPEQAVEAANRTMYGLSSSILAGDTYRAFELAPKILAGCVNVNSPTVNDEIHAPMGGVRDSGWGRTGPDSLKEFQDVIWINSHTGQRQYPI